MLNPRLTTANIAQIIKGRNAIGRKRQGHQLRSIHSGWHCSYYCSLLLLHSRWQTSPKTLSARKLPVNSFIYSPGSTERPNSVILVWRRYWASNESEKRGTPPGQKGLFTLDRRRGLGKFRVS